MLDRDTTSLLWLFDIFQHVCGLCRDELTVNSLLHNIFFISLKYIYLLLIFYGSYHILFQLPLSILSFWQMCLFSNWLFLLVHVSPSKKCFLALMKLDRHCTEDKDFYIEIKRKVRNATIAMTLFVIVDGTLLYLLRLPVVSAIIIALSMVATEIELMFYAMLTNCIRFRLSRLKTESAIAASKIIRYILMVTVQLVADFKMEIFILIGFIMATSYITMIMTFLAEGPIFRIYMATLVWSCLKYTYLVSTVCEATSGYAAEYEDLTNSVARRAELHETTEMTNLEDCAEHEFVIRWYKLMMSFKPRFKAGDCFELDLGVPLRLAEVLISYILLFVQFYSAYFMYDM